MEISILELSIYQFVFRQRSLTDMLPYNYQKSYEDRQKRQYSHFQLKSSVAIQIVDRMEGKVYLDQEAIPFGLFSL